MQVVVQMMKILDPKSKITSIPAKPTEEFIQKQVVEAAEKLGVPSIFEAHTMLTTEDTRVSLLFLSTLFDVRSRLPLDERAARLEKKALLQWREEQTFKIWLNLSPNVDIHVTSLKKDCRNGVVLLQVLSYISMRQVAVSLDKINTNPADIQEEKQNVDYFLSLINNLGIDRGDVTSEDILKGRRHKLLFIIWQLMEYDVTQNRLKVSNTKDAHSIVKNWANKKLKAAASKLSIKKFDEKDLSSGECFFQLLSLIDPTLRGLREQTPKSILNFKYIVSGSRRLGIDCCVKWDDLINVRGRMIFLFLAHLMLYDLSKEQK